MHVPWKATQVGLRRLRTNQRADEVHARIAGLAGHGDEQGRVAEAEVALHEGVLAQVDAARQRAGAHAVDHRCTAQ